jgi:hypothetical protein
MPGFLFHVNATANCPHGGKVQVIPSNIRVLVGGQPVATVADQHAVIGCVFTVGVKPQPCILVTWLTPATRVLVNGQPAVLQSSAGLCKSAEQAPQGPPLVAATQVRVLGS